MYLVALLSGLAVSSLLYLFNKKHHYGKGLTALLFALRTLIVGIVVLLLFNPFMRQKVSVVEQPTILIAQDNSASLVLGKDSLFFKNEYPKLYEEFRNTLQADCQVDQYLFGQEVRDFDSMGFQDQQTDMSSLLQTLDRKYYKRNVGAMVLLSDGVYNRGFDPELLAEKLPFPIFTVILGDTVSYPDLSIKDVFYNKMVAVGSVFPIRVLAGAQDCAGKKAVVSLSENGHVIESRNVDISSNRFSKEIDFMLDADKNGVRQFDIEISGLRDERQKLNNTKRIFVEVSDHKYKILCIADAPHPDIGAFRDVMSENDVMDFVFGKDEIPDFGGYDLVIMHQVPSATVDAGQLADKMNADKNVPVLFVIGERTEIEALNKIQKVFELHKGVTNTTLDVRAFPNPAFGTFTIDERLGNEVGKFPPLALPHTEINTLIQHDDLLCQEVLGVKSGLPLLTFAKDGRKMAFLFGTNVWRWRLTDYYLNKSHDVFNEIFSKTLKYLLINADEDLSVSCKDTYFTTEPVIIKAELRNPSNELVTEPDINIKIVNKLTNDTYDFIFSKHEHDYELNAGFLPEGVYLYTMTTTLAGRNLHVSGSFSVVSLGIEAQQLVADKTRMTTIARLTNGKCYDVTQLQQLAKDLNNDERITSVEHVETRFEDLIHSHWIYFVLIALAALEWLLRKMFGAY